MTPQPMQREPCDACDAPRLETIATRDRDGQPLETSLCTLCGLVRHSILPSEAELRAYYAEEYRRDYHGADAPSKKRVVRAWRRGRGLFERLRPLLAPEALVLEVGAGLGLNLKQFQLEGFRTRGLEPHGAFQRFARETLRVPIERGGLADLACSPDYDLVMFTHVLEHMRSPRQTLTTLRGLLKPRGSIYLECPNVSAPFARPGKLFHRAHIYNFSPGCLRLLAGRCGLRVERSFASDDDPTIAVLLRPSEEERTVPDPSWVRRVRAAIQDTSWLSYHLRPSYARLRAQQLAERAREALTTRRDYARILEVCAKTQADLGRTSRGP